MERTIGVKSIGIRCPIIREGDDLKRIVIDSILTATESNNLTLHDNDVIGITESIVARSEGNYATINHIAKDIHTKFGDNAVGVLFPIMSRNRFAILLKGIARGCQKIIIMFSYPSDEVGNALLSLNELDEKHINPYSDILDIKKYRDLFGYKKHEFTGIDYIEYYQNIVTNENCECEIVFANHAKDILNYTKFVLCCDIHSRSRTKRILKESGAKTVYGLDDILTSSIDGSGYNEQYGLLGSNKADEERVKLFPKAKCKNLVLDIQNELKEKTGKNIEVMIYGDGAFKDPQGKIWELADPVVSPAFTDGLIGTPNELKLKFLADNDYKHLSGNDLKYAIQDSIKKKNSNLKGNMSSEGTTPRQLTDILGSLCDLTSGSGDKGTPIVLIQGYFDNYTNN